MVQKLFGNPFQDESKDQLILTTKSSSLSSAAGLVGTNFEKGQVAFRDNFNDLVGEASFYRSIKKK